jgi:pimeloyl-ACP methyl ester carboxylesterase
MKTVHLAGVCAAVILAVSVPAIAAVNALPKFTDHYANDDGVKIHYVTAGAADKPLVVAIHGYPDFWYAWRGLMAELSGQYRVAAMDTRGYNLSDQPVGVENYKSDKLVKDVEAVIHAEGRKSAIVVGHDWGASIAWSTVLTRPDLVNRLVILSVPHPANLSRELKINPQQQANSAYARNFQKPDSEKSMTAETLAARYKKDPAVQAKYLEAFKRSNFASMMNYYRANYPSTQGDAVVVPTFPKIKVPVLVVHGMKDNALLSPGHNGTWDQVEADTTVLMIPGSGHFIEDDAGPLANRTIHDWLNARPVKAADQKEAQK